MVKFVWCLSNNCKTAKQTTELWGGAIKHGININYNCWSALEYFKNRIAPAVLCKFL